MEKDNHVLVDVSVKRDPYYYISYKDLSENLNIKPPAEKQQAAEDDKNLMDLSLKIDNWQPTSVNAHYKRINEIDNSEHSDVEENAEEGVHKTVGDIKDMPTLLAEIKKTGLKPRINLDLWTALKKIVIKDQNTQTNLNVETKKSSEKKVK